MDDDDIWADGDDVEDSHADLDREWRVRREQFWKEGYREGIEEGKNETLQQGFDAGFKEGIAASRQWGKLTGMASVLHALRQKLGPQDAAKVEELFKLLSVPPRDVMRSVVLETLTTPNPLLATDPTLEPSTSDADGHNAPAAAETRSAAQVPPEAVKLPSPGQGASLLPEVQVSRGLSASERHALVARAEELLRELGFAGAAATGSTATPGDEAVVL